MSATLGLIAGSGRLPFEVAEAASVAGQQVAILAIEANTDPAIRSLATAGFLSIAVGELQRLIDFFHETSADEIILAGAVAKRDAFADPASLKLDARALGLLANLKHRGDDALLRAIADELSGEGLVVVDSTRHLASRLTRAGVLTGEPVDARILEDLALGMRVAKALGKHDVGQSVAVCDGAVLAVEAIAGPDQMMQRAAPFATGAWCLVKTAKPNQDLRFDVPAIGAATIALGAAAGLSAIGLEAGRTLVLERERTLAAAERAGIAIVGLEAEEA
jgi:DUF1009 family protein